MKIVLFTYINHRGDTSERSVLPIRVWFGHTAWHGEDQWLLEAFDLEKQNVKDFAMTGISNWRRKE